PRVASPGRTRPSERACGGSRAGPGGEPAGRSRRRRRPSGGDGRDGRVTSRLGCRGANRGWKGRGRRRGRNPAGNRAPELERGDETPVEPLVASPRQVRVGTWPS